MGPGWQGYASPIHARKLQAGERQVALYLSMVFSECLYSDVRAGYGDMIAVCGHAVAHQAGPDQIVQTIYRQLRFAACRWDDRCTAGEGRM